MKEAWRSGFRSVCHRAGIDINRYRPVEARRADLLRKEGVGLVLDVGANLGQYATSLRKAGFVGRIISFEPISAAFSALAERAAQDTAWDCLNLALSEAGGSAALNVGGDFSSFLTMGAHLQASAPYARVSSIEQVTTARLDSLPLSIQASDRALLKIDVQGFEDRVLAGAGGVMPLIWMVECELSLVSLYHDQPLIFDIVSCLADQGFELRAIEPAFVEPRTGRILQVDGMFVRRRKP